MERLVLGYRRMASESWGNLRWYKVDGEGTIEEVSQSVAEVLREILEIK